jgi:hypothetical protein
LAQNTYPPDFVKIPSKKKDQRAIDLSYYSVLPTISSINRPSFHYNYSVDESMKHYLRLAFISQMILAILLSTSCEQNAPKKQGIEIRLLSGDNQIVDVAQETSEPVKFQVVDVSSGSPLPGAKISIEQIDPKEGASVAKNSVLATSNAGEATLVIVGGSIPAYTTTFAAKVSGTSASINFSLTTKEYIEPLDQKGNQGGEDDKVAGDKGDTGDDGAPIPKPVPSQTPFISHYQIDVDQDLVAGKDFGVKISARNKDNQVLDLLNDSIKLSFSFMSENGDSLTSINTEFYGSFSPEAPATKEYKFTNGYTTIPAASGFKIQKIAPGMVVHLIDIRGHVGQSLALKVKPDALNDLSIVASEEVPNTLEVGQPIKGSNWVENSGKIILSNDPGADPLTISAGTSITMSAIGRDRFGNLFLDPVPVKWYIADVGQTLAQYPTQPLAYKYLAIRAGLASMNLFAPTEPGYSYVSVEWTGKNPDGSAKTISTKTGAIRSVNNLPSTIALSFYNAANGGGIPSTTPVSVSTAGSPLVVKLTASDSLGNPVTTFNYNGPVSLSITGAKASTGFPLAEDATAGNPTTNIRSAVFSGNSLNALGDQSSFTVQAEFTNGVAWVRSIAPEHSTLAGNLKPLAELTFFNSTTRPRVSVAELSNNLIGTRQLDSVLADVAEGMRIVFNSAQAVNPADSATYPSGIIEGRSVKKLTTSMGENTLLSAATYDRFGNNRGYEKADWQGIGGLVNAAIQSRINSSSALYTPLAINTLAGRKISASLVSNPSVTAETDDIFVQEGIPVAYVISPISPLVAGVKFGLRIEAVGSGGTPAPDYDGLKNIKVQINGALIDPVASFFANAGAHNAHMNLLNSYRASRMVTGINFTDGVAEILATSSHSIAFYSAKELPSFTLISEDNKIVGVSAALPIKHAPLFDIDGKFKEGFVTIDSGNTYTYTKGNSVGSTILGNGTRLKLEAIGYDKFLNEIGAIDVDWTNSRTDDTPTPDVPVIDFNGSASNFFFTDTTSVNNYGPNLAGKAFIKMQTPVGFCGTIMDCEPATGPIAGYTGVIDVKIGVPKKVQILTTDPANPPVTAGQGFSIVLRLLDATGNFVNNFSGSLQLVSADVMSLPGEAMSPFAYSNLTPAAQLVQFTNGEATLPGFVLYNMYDVPRLKVTVLGPDNSPLDNSAGISPPLVVNPGPNYTMRIINLPQIDGATNRGTRYRPFIYNAITNPLTVYSSSAADVYAGYFDQFGNWKGDAVVYWQTPTDAAVVGMPRPANAEDCEAVDTTKFPNNFISKITPVGTSTGSKKTSVQSGTNQGKACLSITNTGTSIPGGNTYLLTDIKITEALPAKLRITIIDENNKKRIQNIGGEPTVEPGFQLVSNKPFGMKIEVIDDTNQLAAGISIPNQSYSIRLENAQNSGTCTGVNVPVDVRLENGASVDNLTSTTITKQFITAGGVVLPHEIGSFYVPKSEVPFNIVVDATVSGIALSPGILNGVSVKDDVLHRVNIHNEPNGGGTAIQGTTVTLSVDGSLSMFAAGFDSVCNFIADQATDWTATGTMSGKLLGNLTGGLFVTGKPTVVGAGAVQGKGQGITDVAVPCTLCGKVSVDVVPGAPKNMVITTERNNIERAGVPFNYSIVVKDDFGNTVTGFNGLKEVTYSWDAQSVVGGLAPILPSLSAHRTFNFINGELDPTSFTAVKELTLAKANTDVNLTITIIDAGNTMIGSTVINTVVGPIGSINVYEVAMSPVEVTTTLTKSSDLTSVFASYGTDIAGNLIGQVPGTWTTSGVIAPADLDRLTGPVVVLNPGAIGSGGIGLSHSRIGDPDIADTVLTDSISLSIITGNARYFKIFTEKRYKKEVLVDGTTVLDETAGSAFNLKIVAYDNEGTIDLGFSSSDPQSRGINYGSVQFAFAILDSDSLWPSQPTIAAAAVPASVTVSFTDGVATISDLKLFKAFDDPSFRITLTSTITHILNNQASTGAISVIPDIPHALKLATVDASGTRTLLPRDTDAALMPAMTTDDQLQIYAIGHDAFGNYTGPQNATWTGTADTVNMLTPVSGPASYLAPKKIGSGRVRATPVAALTDSTPYETKLVTVTAGRPTQFEIVAPAVVTADQYFTVSIVAKDIGGNNVTSFPNGQSFSFTVDGASLSPSGLADSAPPSDKSPLTQTISTFNAPTPWLANVAALFKLVNSKDTAILKLSWTDSFGTVRTGVSGLIKVQPGVVVSRRISTAETGTLVDMPTANLAVGQPFLYYANGFDSVGNFVSNQTVLWKGTDALQPIVLDGAADLVAVSINKTPKKVKTTLTGDPNEPVTGSAVVEIRDPASPGVIFDTVEVTLNPGPASKMVSYVVDGTLSVPTTAGAYRLPQEVIAGRAYRYRVELQDVEGNRSAETSSKTAIADVPNTATFISEMGLVPTIVQPPTLAFTNGLWTSDAASIVTYTKSGLSHIRSTDTSSSALPSVKTLVNVTNDTVAAHIRIASGSIALSPVFQPQNVAVNLVASTSKNLFASQFDAGGNWLGLASAEWTGYLNLADPIIATGYVGSQITFTPLVSSVANRVKIEWDHDNNAGTSKLSYELTNVAIGAGYDFSSIEVTSNLPSPLSADNCFDVTLKVKDSVNNTAVTYQGLRTINFTYSGAFTANYAGHSDQNTYPTNAPLTFFEGVAGPIQFCLRDASSSATITATDNLQPVGADFLKGSINFVVNPGVAKRIEFSDAQRDGVGEPEAAPFCDLITNADQVNKNIYLSVHDQWGNVLNSYNTSTFTIADGGVLDGKMTPVNSKQFSITPTIASMITSTVETNVGTITLSNIGTLKVCEVAGSNNPLKVHVNPGVPVGYSVTVNNSLPVVATSGFPINVKAVDTYANTAWSIDSLNPDLTFTWVGTPLSSPTLNILGAPAIQAPQLVSSPVTPLFVDGLYSTLPNNRLGNALQTALQVSVGSTGLSTGTSPQIVVEAGPKSRIILTTDPVTGFPVYENNEHRPYTATPILYAASYDSLGNFKASNEAVTWATVSGFELVTTNPNPNLVELLGASNSQRTLQTKTISGQKVTGAKANVSVSHAGLSSGPISYDVNVFFDPSPATKLVPILVVDGSNNIISDLSVVSYPTVSANDNFYVVVEARDVNDNVEATFPTSFTLGVSAVAPNYDDISVSPQVTRNSAVPAGGSQTFNWNGKLGQAAIGPFKFVAAGSNHSISITDNDVARILTAANISQVNVVPGAIDRFRFMSADTNTPVFADIIHDPYTIATGVSSLTWYNAAFDAIGNFIGKRPANYNFTFSSCPACTVGINGSASSTVVIAPISAGQGVLRSTGIGANSAITHNSPVITIQSNAAASFVLEPLFNDQDTVTAGEQSLAVANLTSLSSARVFASEADINNRFQRATIPFGMRLKAVDVNNNVADNYCGSRNTGNAAITTPKICEVKVSYTVNPANGPNGSLPTPAANATLYVRWVDGYGVFVDPMDYAVLVRPFNMRKANENVTISVLSESDQVTGTSSLIPIKPGVLNSLKLRSLAGNLGEIYLPTYIGLTESSSMLAHAAGFDLAENYIADQLAAWSVANNRVALTPSSGTVSTVQVGGLSIGAESLTATVAAAGEHGLITTTLAMDIKPTVPLSYRLTLVDNLEAPVTLVEVSAGETFRVKVEAMSGISGTGVVVGSYIDGKKLLFSAVGMVPSDLGMEWTKATPNTAPDIYEFTTGKKVLDGFKFTAVPPLNGGEVQLIVVNEDASLAGTLKIKNKLGQPGHVRIRRGAVKTDPEMIGTPFQYAAGSTYPIYAHLYDKGGNWLRLENAAWDYKNILPPNPTPNTLAPANGIENPVTFAIGSSASGFSSLNFIPAQVNVVESGVVTAVVATTVNSLPVNLSFSVSNITVSGIDAVSFAIVTENNDTTWAANQCFSLRVEARNGASGLSTTYTGLRNLTWSTTLGNGTTPYPTEISGGDPVSKAVTRLVNGSYAFSDGIYNAPAQTFCLRDATDIGPSNIVRIKVADNSFTPAIEGYVDITVSKGAPIRYGLYPSNAESAPVCDVVSITSGTASRTYYLHETDSVGNFIRQLDATWTPIGSLNNAGVVTTASGGSVTVNPTKVGIGTLKYNFTGDPAPLGAPAVLACNPIFDIVNSRARYLSLQTQGGLSGEVATNDFTAKVQVLDEQGNTHVDFNQTINLTFLTNATNSPYNDAVKTAGATGVQTATVSATFVNGNWESSAAQKFNFPKAYQAPSLSVSSDVAGGVGFVHASGLLPSSIPNILILPGPIAGIQFRNALGSSGVLVDSAWVSSTAALMSTTSTWNFFAATNDAKGNFIANTDDVTWSKPTDASVTYPGPLAQDLDTAASNGVVIFAPKYASDGVIRISGQNTLSAYQWDSALITVLPSAAAKWRVTAWDPLANSGAGGPKATAVAGEVIQVKVEAIDGSGTPDINVDGLRTISVAVYGANPAPAPYSATYVPQLNGAPIVNDTPQDQTLTFTDGIAFISNVSFFNSNDLVLVQVSGNGLITGVSPSVDVTPANMAAVQIRYADGTFGISPKSHAADKPLSFEVRGRDVYGNVKGYLTAGLTANFAGIANYDQFTSLIDTADRFTGSFNPVNVDPANVSAVFIPDRAGKGFIQVDCSTDALCIGASITTYKTSEITINPGAVKKFSVDVTGAVEQTYSGFSYTPVKYASKYAWKASESFHIRVSAVDANNNIVTSYVNPGSLQFIFGSEVSDTTDMANLGSPRSASPNYAGYPLSPERPQGSLDWSFQNGVWVSSKNAGTQFRLRRAGIRPYVIVKTQDGTITGKSDERIDIEASTLSEIVPRKEANNGGLIHSGYSQGSFPGPTYADSCTDGSAAKMTVQSAENVRIYLAGYDADGNYIDDTTSDWSFTTNAVPAAGLNGTAFSNHSGSDVLGPSKYIEFKPMTTGTWSLFASTATPSVASRICVAVQTSAPSKFKVFIVKDTDGDSVLDGGETSLEGASQQIGAGECYSLGIKLLDSSNNPTTWNGTLAQVDFVSDAPIGPSGFLPRPYGEPMILSNLTFVNGFYITPKATTGRCSVSGNFGTFVMHKISPVPTPNTYFLRASDGVGTGMEDAQIDIKVNVGTIDHVALMLGNPSDAANGKIIGTSREQSALDMTNAANWDILEPDPEYRCTTIKKDAGFCTDGLLDPTVTNLVAGTRPGVTKTGYYLSAFDGGGNYLGAPTGNFTSTVTTLGNRASNDPLLLPPNPAPISTWFPQYVIAQNNYPGDTNSATVNNTNGIYFRPMLPIAAGRVTVTNVQFGGRTFVLANTFPITVKPAALAQTGVIFDLATFGANTPRYLAGKRADNSTDGGAEIRVRFYDSLNNLTESLSAEFDLGLYLAADTGFTTDIKSEESLRLPVSGGFNILNGEYIFPASASKFFLARQDYVFRIKSKVNSVDYFATRDFDVFAAYPYAQTIVPWGEAVLDRNINDQPVPFFKTLSINNNFEANTGEIIFSKSVDEDVELAAAVMDKFGNLLTYTKYGWESNSANDGVGIYGDAHAITYLDLNGNIIANPPEYVKNLLLPNNSTANLPINFSERVVAKFKKEGILPPINTWYTEPTTVTNPANPLNNYNFTLIDGRQSTTEPTQLLTKAKTGYPNCPGGLPCYISATHGQLDFSNVKGGLPYSVKVLHGSHNWQSTIYRLPVPPIKFVNTSADELGDPFYVTFGLYDQFDNTAKAVDGRIVTYNIIWNQTKVLNATDMCTNRNLNPGECATESTAINPVTARARDWGRAAQLNNVTGASGTYQSQHITTLALNLAGNDFSNYVINTTNTFVQVNRTNPEYKIKVTGGDGNAADWANVVNDESQYFEITTIPTGGVVDAFATVSTGSANNKHFDRLPLFDSVTPSLDRSWYTNESGSLFISFFDKFGNYKFSPQPSDVEWSISNWRDANNVTAGVTEASVTQQFNAWPFASPLTFGTSNRIARKAEFSASVRYLAPGEPSFQFTVTPGVSPTNTIESINIPPGPMTLDVYADANPATTAYPAGQNLVVGQTYYLSGRIFDTLGNSYLYTNAATQFNFSDDGTVDLNDQFEKWGAFPATATYKVCNGVIMDVAFDLQTCPANGSLPSTTGWAKIPFEVRSTVSSSGDRRISVNATINTYAAYGRTKTFTVTAGSHDHYITKGVEELNLENVAGSPGQVRAKSSKSITVVAVDLFGNPTANIHPSAEDSVQIKILNPNGTNTTNLCADGVALASCPTSSYVVRCGIDGGTVGNCLSQRINIRTKGGSATLTGFEIDWTGTYYVVAESTLGGKVTHSAPAELPVRASSTKVNCTMADCVNGFTIVHPTAVSTGPTFNVTLRAVDIKNRLLTDATIMAALSSEPLEWNANLPALVNGVAPQNRPALGYVTGDFSAGNRQVTRAFTGGLSSFVLQTNNYVTIPQSDFSISMVNYPTKTGTATSDIIVTRGGIYQYQVGTVDGLNAWVDLDNIPATPSDKFTIRVDALDRGGNYFDDTTPVKIVPQKISGTYTNSGVFQVDQASPPTEPTCAPVGGTCNVSNVFYLVGNRVRMAVENWAGLYIAQEDIQFVVQSGTIANYEYTFPATVNAFNPANFPTGTPNYTGTGSVATITAQDGAGNTITSLDSFLDTNANTSNFGSTYYNGSAWVTSCATAARDWTNGVTTCPLAATKAGTYLPTEHKVTIGGSDYFAQAAFVVLPNERSAIRICNADAYCAASLANFSKTADASTVSMYVTGYDYYDNFRPGEVFTTPWGTDFSSKVPGTLAINTDYVFTPSGSQLTIQPLKVPQVFSGAGNTTLTATATVGSLTQSVTVTALPGPLAIFRAETFTNLNTCTAGVPGGCDGMTADVSASVNTNFSASNFKAYYQIGTGLYPKVDITGTQTIQVTYDPSLASSPLPAASFACVFANGVCSTPFNFFINRPNSAASNRYLRFNLATAPSILQNIQPIRVEPGLAHHIIVSSLNPASPTIGQAFTLTAHMRDQQNNLTDYCSTFMTPVSSTLRLAEVSGGSARSNRLGIPTATTQNATFATAQNLTKTGLGTYEITGQQIYRSASDSTDATGIITITSGGSCGSYTVSHTFSTIQNPSGQPSHVFLSKTNSTNIIAASTDYDCTQNSPVSCPVYAYAYDSYGNPFGAAGAPASLTGWGFSTCNVNSGSGPCGGGSPSGAGVVSSPSPITAAASSLTMSSSTLGLDHTASITYTPPATGTPVTKYAQVRQRIINRPSSVSCGQWLCNAANSKRPETQCTLTNSTGYTASGFAFTGIQATQYETTTTGGMGTSNSGLLATAGTWQFLYRGVSTSPGADHSGMTLIGTPDTVYNMGGGGIYGTTSVVSFSNPSQASFTSPVIGSNVTRPNCADTITTSSAVAVACSAGQVDINYNMSTTNNIYGLTYASLASGSFNGGTIQSSTCAASLAGNASGASNSCTFRVRYTGRASGSNTINAGVTLTGASATHHGVPNYPSFSTTFNCP